MAEHTCHWPGCRTEVPPSLWGCRGHWYTLPQELRSRIWAAYVKGQEITKTPSAAYLKVADEAHAWAIAWEKQRAAQVQASARAAALPVQGSLL